MRQTRTIEISTGAFIILGFLALMFLATKTTNISSYSNTRGYTVHAEFTNIGALKVRSPVTMAGVAVGRVTDIRLDTKSFSAVVTMEIYGSVSDIPDDSTASILTEGLLGSQYIGIDAGGSDSFLKNGSAIQYTQSAIVIEKLIGQVLAKFTAPSAGAK